MCAPEESSNNKNKNSSSKMDFVRATATTSSSSFSPPSPRPSSPMDLLQGMLKPTSAIKQPTQSRMFHRQSSSILADVATHGFHLTIGSAISYATVLFSLYFPFVLAPWAASQTYHNAFFEYDANLSHFDNTAWTYGTDYLLTVCMFVLAKSINYSVVAPISIHNPHKDDHDDDDLAMVGRAHHKWWSRGLLWSYMVSVLAGGVAHQFYLTPDDRNLLSFRILWTCCVGTVTAASGFMGAIGAELVRQDAVICRRHQQKQQQGKGQVGNNNNNDSMAAMPILPEAFWLGFGVIATAVVICGGFSFQRPACDIFIAGITQFPSTFFLIYIFAFGLKTSLPTIQPWARVVGMLGFILNAPLLPMYPLLVQYTDWSLGSVNTLLHTWLLVAWTMQGISLRHVGQALQVAAEGVVLNKQSSSPDAKVDKPKIS